jgi:hypothetical protein
MIADAIGVRARVRAAMLASAIAGSVLQPLAVNLDDDSLRSQLLRQARMLLPRGRKTR